MADVSEHADLPSKVEGHTADTAQVTSPTQVIHLVRDLRGVLTDDRRAELQADLDRHPASSQGKEKRNLETFLSTLNDTASSPAAKNDLLPAVERVGVEEGRVVDLTRKAAEDDIKAFLNAWGEQDICASIPVPVGAIILENFDTQRWINYSLSASDTAAVRAALMHHLEFFATTFYVCSPILERGIRPDASPDAEPILKALRAHIKSTKPATTIYLR